MGVRLNERREMEFLNYHVSGMHVLKSSTRVRVGLAIVRLGLQVGAWLAGFKVVVDEPQVDLFRKSLDGHIEVS